MHRSCPHPRTLQRLAALVAIVLTACSPARTAPAILVAAPTTGMIAVTAQGSASVRVLYVRGGSIVLLRTVALPKGDAVQSIRWSSDERDVLITSSEELLALDTRTWRLDALPQLAAAARDDAGAKRVR